MRSNHRLLYMQLLVSTVCCTSGNQEKLLYTTHNYIKEKDLETGVVKELANQTGFIYSIAYDVKERYVYASRYYHNEILRFPYPSDQTVNFEIVISTNNPFAVAFDSENRHVYWTNYNSGTIMRCNSDGSDLTTIVNDTSAFALALDPHNRWIYYSIFASDALHRVGFDGKEKQVLINVAGLATDINVDFIGKQVYWMLYYTGELKSAWYDGSDVKTVVSANASYNNREFDIEGDYVFFTKYNTTVKIHKSSGQISAIVHTEVIQMDGLLYLNQEDSGAVINIQKATSMVITIATVGILKYLL